MPSSKPSSSRWSDLFTTLTLLASDGSVLHQALCHNIASIKAELVSRRPAGQQLDQALSREKGTRQAREAAEKHVAGLEKSLASARATLEQAKHAEDQALADTAKIRAQLAEVEAVPVAVPEPLPVDVTSAIWGILHQAGIGAGRVTAMLPLLGVSELPPEPPLPVPAVPAPAPAAMPPLLAHNQSMPGNCPPQVHTAIPQAMHKDTSPTPSRGGRSRSGTPRGRRAGSTSSRGTSHTARTARTQLDTPATTVAPTQPRT